jgi:hypothetical protein
MNLILLEQIREYEQQITSVLELSIYIAGVWLGSQIVIDLERCDGCGQYVTDSCGHAIELPG